MQLTMSRDRNPVNLKKLPGSKWTAVQPVDREKHFVVLGWELDERGEPTDRVELEAVLTRAVRRIAWRKLRDRGQWLIGWR